MSEPLLVLLGPTASGKEAAAVHAAPALDAEIVTADSVKPYRGLTIAAAAPSAAQRARVPHHLVGILDPAERLSAARWLEAAESAFADIRARDRRPLVVGGTALYLKALLFGLFEGPPADHELREELRALEASEPGALHTRLRLADPVAADRIHANDVKRLVRALEVVAATGRPISERQTQWTGAPGRSVLLAGIRRTPEDLRARISGRVGRMVDAGLLDEIRALVPEGALGPTAGEAIGVKELVPVLREECASDSPAMAEALEAVTRHTRHLARRQRTWFKRFDDVDWLDVAPDASPEDTGMRVAESFLGRLKDTDVT